MVLVHVLTSLSCGSPLNQPTKDLAEITLGFFWNKQNQSINQMDKKKFAISAPTGVKVINQEFYIHVVDVVDENSPIYSNVLHV